MVVRTRRWGHNAGIPAQKPTDPCHCRQHSRVPRRCWRACRMGSASFGPATQSEVCCPLVELRCHNLCKTILYEDGQYRNPRNRKAVAIFTENYSWTVDRNRFGNLVEAYKELRSYNYATCWFCVCEIFVWRGVYFLKLLFNFFSKL